MPESTSAARSDERATRARIRLQRVGDFFAHQRHLIAIRDGVVGSLPLVLVGSLFLLVAQPPVPVLQHWIAPYVPVLLVPYRMLGGLISLYVAFCTAHSLAKSYQLDPMSAGLGALAAYFIAAFPTPALAGLGADPAPPWVMDVMQPRLLGATSPVLAPVLPLGRLGAGGIFAALVLALLSVELTRFIVRSRWTIRMPDSSPGIVGRSFLALIPTFVVVVLTFCVTHLFKVDLISLLERLARPLLVATGSLYAAIGVVFIDSALWLLGVHASAALATLKPFWETMLVQNMEAAAQGLKVLPHIASLEFYRWFVWQGGSGATLPLALLLTRARSAQLKGVGRVGLLPAICNINEPILFGAPVVLNATLAIPFFTVPVLSTVCGYVAFSAGWVTRPYLEMPWTLPAPLGAYLSTGGDWRAVVLQLFNLGVGLLVYWPFVRRYDRRLEVGEATGVMLSSTAQSS